ncbi:MAG: ubiquinol-cytochrome chaperone [Alphaproteobacteria bacterium]|nr:ubiquinol-cytochrome chaperone [Alphaproteobacteria bacterium]
MSFLGRIFGSGAKERARFEPLYHALVAAGRDRAWYAEGAVPDTVEGRFDMIAAILAVTLIRLEAEGAAARQASVLLAELFIADMEGSLRQMGTGDLMVGKHLGKMMGALGGRLGAFRAAIAAGGDLSAPVERNIFHDAPPSPEALRFVAERLGVFAGALAATPAEAILDGRVPAR